MSLIFKKIEIRNFLSFGNNTQDLNLEFDGTTLVVGENLDAGGANGVGKCVSYDTLINIRNKKTGEIISIKIGELYEKMASKGELR